MMEMITAADTAAMMNEIGVDAHDEYIRIGEMAKKHGVTLRTLRFYEDKGLLMPRREGSMRLYTRRDNARLKLILLGRKVGFSLREVKQMIDLYDPSGSNTRQLKMALEKSERQLARLQKQRQAIDDAIGDLNVAMMAVRAILSDSQPSRPRSPDPLFHYRVSRWGCLVFSPGHSMAGLFFRPPYIAALSFGMLCSLFGGTG